MFFNDNYHYFKKNFPPNRGGDGGEREGVVVVEKGQFRIHGKWGGEL